MAGAGAPAAPDAAAGVFDVIVVGAGIMGSCTAYAASSRGARVLLLERFDLLHALGSSRMVRLARRLWADAEAEAGYRTSPWARALLAAVANDGAQEITWRRRLQLQTSG